MRTLIDTIFNCHEYNRLKITPDPQADCNDIVDYQRSAVNNLGTAPCFQNPEPFSGNISRSPVMVVGSNPSLNSHEVYPNYNPGIKWPKDIIHDFFINRFKDRGPRHSWVYNNQVLERSMTGNVGRGRQTPTWTEIQNQMSRIKGNVAVPGLDYCFADLVHCKSPRKIGVANACNYCAKMYFHGLVAVASPAIILAIGSDAKNYFGTQWNSISNYNGSLLVTLPAPGSALPRNIDLVFSEEQRQELQGAFQNHNANELEEFMTDEAVMDWIDNNIY